MLPRAAAYVVLPAATIVGVVVAWMVVARDAPPPGGNDDRLPHRCAATADLVPEGERIRELDTDGDTLVLGVVADARGALPDTLAGLDAARRAFREAGVELVLSLGGMGDDAAELAAVYRALAADAGWRVVAIPGDREPLAAHREAVAQLAPSEALIDGTLVRIVAAGQVKVATFPGVADPSQLVAGADGCYYEAADADDLAAWLRSKDGVTVWASYAPPRQRGPEASDRSRGVHVGDPVLARAVRASGAALALHALVDEASLRPAEGTRRLDMGGFIGLAPGPAEALPVLGEDGAVAAGRALIVRIAPTRLDWERIDLAAGRDFEEAAGDSGASE